MYNENDKFPGNKLEDFVLYALNAIINTVHIDASAYNKKLATFQGQPTVLEQWQFNEILKLFEPYRESVEQCLDKFDNSFDSWYSYQQFSMVFIPEQIYLTVQRLLCSNFLR